jgi:hypothetical protein
LDSCLITTRSKRAWMFELKEFVTRASFVDMFDCVMNMGANTAPFNPKLVTFTRAWMNSEVKRLPLTAFREANKISNEFPRTKFTAVAEIKRSGSADVKTLAVAGSVVPLVEGHADTRKRWTANLATFSDTERIKQDGPPYCEFVFKGGQKLELRLREYIRERGLGPWLSVATTDSGSYKMPDVIRFLTTHLPDNFSPQSRQWRISIADAFSAHLPPQVFKLCWNRGYVLITLGGGITPVVQTCDTDFNQHVKMH